MLLVSLAKRLAAMARASVNTMLLSDPQTWIS